ncbi:MAG: alcohol dehydrogenase catalytic domain-containing protein [Desulfarculaceae bacterium]|nr:alcohol dehydrogenase catalytic domain-containing protein [Desulfarculaceae bacterium]MCF8071971.1 alcohol dehydrogenase catalytic domain-containing protein [Desulfarculaceae bacterium]MCF8101488.1 alcohol dehydrogenase catalytic domain-containing protein [Desulfarculaceae bacterium]MCF8115038.1 alcohol dehydrogenase catalytic domain-containing protein [Desulfarculaceae bacterium]
MKAVVCSREHGLRFSEAPTPEAGPGEVVVRVADTGVCGSDISFIKKGFFQEGYILGHEISAVVHQVGGGVEGWEPGQRVMMRPTFCGQCSFCAGGKPHFCSEYRRLLGVRDLPGGFAEYVRVLPGMLIPIPEGVDSRNAALAEVFASSYHGLNCSGAKGGSALVMGGGPIGLAMVALLKLHGFGPILLSEPIKAKRELGLGFGADAAVDPLKDNLGYTVFDLTDNLGFDAIFECSGIAGNVPLALDFIAVRGRITVVSVISEEARIPMRRLTFTEAKITASISNTHQENRQILDWMAQGKLDARPMISDLISLEELPAVFNQRILAGKSVKTLLKIGPEF